MDEQVRSELAEVLKTGGRNLCTIPRVLVNLLRQRCPDAESAVSEIEQALSAGCVRSMLEAVGEIDEQELADRLVNHSGMTPERARWVIEIWVHALSAADTPQTVARDWSYWNKLDVSKDTAGGTGVFQRAVFHLIVVGVAGAAGGATLGIQQLAGGDPGVIATCREALEDLSPGLQGAALVALGILGGFAGAILGWIIVGGRSWTYEVLGGTTLGRLVIGSIGAFVGALIGVLVGIEVMGLVGVMVGALIGGLAGSALGLVIVEGIAQYWW